MKGSFSLLPVLAVVSCLALSGCTSTSTPTSSRYPVTHAGSIQKVEKGTVVASRQVKIDGVATNMGRLVGAGVGAAVGAVAVPVKTDVVVQETSPGIVNINASSNKHENDAAMAVGGAVGMIVGQKVEKMVTATKAQELTIALDSGETVLVVQKYREPAFYENDRVKLYTTRAGDSIVYHAHEDPAMDPDTNAYLVGEGEEEFEPIEF